MRRACRRPAACGPPGVLYLAVHCLTGFGFIFDLMARTEIRSTSRPLTLARLQAQSREEARPKTTGARVLINGHSAWTHTARYNIRGNALGDCCTAYCCIPCTQGQHSREIRLEEESVRARTHGGPLAAPGQAAPMQPQQPMQYPPPSKAA